MRYLEINFSKLDAGTSNSLILTCFRLRSSFIPEGAKQTRPKKAKRKYIPIIAWASYSEGELLDALIVK